MIAVLGDVLVAQCGQWCAVAQPSRCPTPPPKKSAWFTWPLWRVALSAAVARNLIQSAPRDPMIPDTYISAATAWGVHRLMRSRITRSDQGGYGTFRPAMLVWSNPTAPQPEQLP